MSASPSRIVLGKLSGCVPHRPTVEAEAARLAGPAEVKATVASDLAAVDDAGKSGKAIRTSDGNP
jgi:hypothetical protein